MTVAKSEIQLSLVTPEDAESLVAIRIAAMRDSLTRIGRFDPKRAKERFLAGFSPQHTRHINLAGQRVGFVVAKPFDGVLLLDHLYILPEWQSNGVGAAVLRTVFAEADAMQLSVRVGALRESDSNRFYVQHGFQFVECTEYDNYYVRQPKSAA